MHPPLSSLPWPSVRALRWGSGLVLMAYACVHLLNHALGLVSLSVAETGLQLAASFWHSVAGTTLLYGAAALHVLLAGATVWQRRTLRMPAMEALRLLLGLSLPLLMASHVTAMRWGHALYALDGSYTWVVRALWTPSGAALQLSLMAAAWTHGCLGLHLAWRVQPLYGRLRPLLLGLAIAVPVAAALGFLAMGRELAWTDVPPVPLPSAAQAQALGRAADRFEWLYLAALLTLLIARFGRSGADRLASSSTLAIRYPDQTVRVPPGWSVLEASRAHGIPHLSLCGGRARCSTCRVRVSGDPAHLPAPSADERRTLARVQAAPDVRLACQLRPTGDIVVSPLFAPSGTPGDYRGGQEREVAIVFVDLRRWSGLSERQLPFDLVYVLHRYFELVGAAVREAGGVANQFIGDSVMAIFGLNTDLPEACRQALHASELIRQRMDEWSAQFQTQFGQRLDFGIGVHAGRTAVGEVGYRDTTSFTAIGEVVNTASRLQEHTKTSGARLVVSEYAAQQAGVAQTLGPVETLQVRGRAAPLRVFSVGAAQGQ